MKISKLRYKIIKPLVFVACLIALTIQSFHLLVEYKKYKTVVTVRIERRSVIEFPGISVCESHHTVKVNRYNDGQWNISVPRGIWHQISQKDPEKFNQISNQVMNYTDFVNYFHNGSYVAKDVFGPIDDSFITCKLKRGSIPCSPINYLSGYFSQCKTYFNTIYLNGSSVNVPKSTHTISDKDWDNDMARITIKKSKLNHLHTNQITVLINPANSMPIYTVQKLAFRQNQLKFGRNYDLTFSKTKIIKPQKPYKPFCHSYQDNTDVKSYSECFVKCVQRNIIQKYDCLMPEMDITLNDQFQNIRLCNASEILHTKHQSQLQLDSFKWTTQCKSKSCLPDCIQEIYNYEIKDVTDSLMFFRRKAINNDTIIMNILPVNGEEYTYIHQPKISWNDLMSKFGGLLSLWIGFSFYSIYRHSESFFKRQFVKHVSFNQI